MHLFHFQTILCISVMIQAAKNHQCILISLTHGSRNWKKCSSILKMENWKLGHWQIINKLHKNNPHNMASDGEQGSAKERKVPEAKCNKCQISSDFYWFISTAEHLCVQRFHPIHPLVNSFWPFNFDNIEAVHGDLFFLYWPGGHGRPHTGNHTLEYWLVHWLVNL